MSFEAHARDIGIVGDFTDFVDAANKGLLPSAKKRGRKPCGPGVKQRLSQASLIAPLLAMEGCLTLGDEGGALVTDQEPVGGVGPTTVQAVDDSNFHADIDGELFIAPSDLLANDQAPEGVTLEIVRVFGATHGEVVLVDGLIHFTPDFGYEGMANFFYEVRDSNGNLSQASVGIHVGEPVEGGHSGGGHSGGMAHPDDPDKMSEHMAMLELVPVEDATHVAVNNGSWFDPNTWQNGVIPGDDAKVYIPEGIEVLYDGESAVSLFTVRVDGALEFATDKDTFMEVDTMVVTPAGRLTIGTIDNPVAANVRSVIQIADNGPIDVGWDPQLLSRGLISHGEINVHGAFKDTFLKVAADPMAGDTSMTLESVPAGWQVGDRLVLTGTHLTATEYPKSGEPRNSDTEDEELIITSISGNVIHFDRPLEYDHEGARADLKAYVANYTRNVVVETENADGLPPSQRGHVMLMHSDDIDVRYAEFSDLGRTDKSVRAVDVADLDTVESDSNIKARYALHLHRVGVDDPENPAVLVGNTVWGSPGWGFVQHDSNALMTDNAAYDTWGAGFVAETGNEIGRWSHNISIKTTGTAGGPKWHEDVLAFDLGRTGANFWFQGRLVDAVDNVAAGSPGGHGFVYMSRGNGMIDVKTSTADHPETLHYFDYVRVNLPSISQFENNEAIAVRVGVQVVKANSQQHHDDRTVLADFLGWEVETGVHIQYTAHYTLENIDVIGATQKGGGVAGWRGIEFGPSVIDTVVNGANIAGFRDGINYSKSTTGLNESFDGSWDYVFIDVNFEDTVNHIPNLGPEDTILSSSDLRSGPLLFDPDYDGIWDVPAKGGDYFVLSATKTDGIGEVDISPEWDPEKINFLSVRAAIQKEGYWTLPDGRIVTQVEQYYSDRVTGEIDKISHFVYWEQNLDGLEVAPVYHGILDLDSNVPIARADFATTGVEERVVIDVLANDYDPDGDQIQVDGIDQPTHGSVFLNDNGTLTYAPDPNYVGSDEFWYWVEDDNGNFTKGHVTVTVEV